MLLSVAEHAKCPNTEWHLIPLRFSLGPRPKTNPRSGDETNLDFILSLWNDYSGTKYLRYPCSVCSPGLKKWSKASKVWTAPFFISHYLHCIVCACVLFIHCVLTHHNVTVLYHSSVSSSCMIRIFLNMFRAWLLPCLMYSSRTRCSHIPRLFGESLGMRLHAREGRVWLNVTAKFFFFFFFSMDKCSYW